MDPITSQAYVRNDLAVKTDWKPSVDRVVTYEVVTPLPATVGPVGPQVEPGNFLPGGGQQVQMNVPGPDRMSYLKVVSVRTLGP